MAAVAFISFRFPGVDGVSCAFTSRRGGGSQPPYNGANLSYEVGDDPDAVTANRRLVFDRFGLDGWAECVQVHGDVVRTDPDPVGPDVSATMEGDGLTTSTPGVGLIVKTADCQPILLAHRSGRYVAGLHSGWRGNKINFPGTGVRVFCETYGLDPADVFAVRGPSLGPDNAEFRNFADDFGPGFDAYFSPATRTVDLWRLTRDQLMGAGVPESNIHAVDICTMADAETFFSYRRAGTRPGNVTGRQAGLIWIKQGATS